MYNKVQGHRAVAALYGLEVLRVVTALGVGVSIPDVASANGYCEFCGSEIADGQVYGHGAVTTVDGLEYLSVVASLGISLTIPGIGAT